MITTSHVYFENVRPKCTHPRPANYWFYKRADEYYERWDPDDPIWLRPYLGFGFGQSPPRQIVGATSRISPPTNVPIIKLKLTLCQIGSWTTLNYSGGLTSAKKQALRMLHEGKVDQDMEPGFAEIVQWCLR